MTLRTRDRDREGGWLLIEILIALTVLTVGILGFLFSFQANYRATQEMGNRDLAQAALQSAVETLQQADFGTLYGSYNNATFPAPGLTAPDGMPAQVRVAFFVNETTLPAEFGPAQDIDGDGANTSINASVSYVLLPARISLTYQMAYGPETESIFLILRE